ncbi:related to transforming acidic coiled-coil containing protein 3 [Fusarium fujikuroi]|uniref:Related to transforming acidic coiled-coil containing protein 3 n=1 Tax=Gibberella fujikuroi (strain CBS 195.34 / IMI 58289 / NRRL A-6831) TaxID=1279085 RepID=S0DM99_GIBF5|nr:related to transforming acidic coiled-coil containing protein 3 [Fusarium fujikuroi IMI 58289]KLO84665.1 transforming acidic coiled-coil containing protein 3 [Fusarium fujikuroi]KLP08296.1 transforming acidic coiled-coil containing protein 3 [Fusarium fujikuroi]CCT63560.1 related to transforming acidic coiled-coil containing protein 3 [Fusarium fujikuroi IMI 58289]SCN68326.1 related to transforming acidic coiled-coil containing protein 3 [Fusarium fujikuroi]SCN91064.1 related to transformin
MRNALLILSGITTIATTYASPVASSTTPLITSPVATSILDPVAPPVFAAVTTPEDIHAVIREVSSLASDIYFTASNIGGGGVEVENIGNTYLRCRDMIEGVQQAFDKVGDRPQTPFSYENQKGICSIFDSFGIDQSKLITMLVRYLQSIARDGFIDHFGDCFNRLQPALSMFIEELTFYAPDCEFAMLRRKDQLEVGLSSALGRVLDYREGHAPDNIPLSLD